jgi:glutamate racemase
VQVDLVARTRYGMSMTNPPKILVFDSGLGGLTVLAEVARLRPDAALVYAADTAGFPYGALPPDVLLERVVAVIARLVARFAPDVVVIACNTASTLVLPSLRGKFPELPFVGTVPAIKPAAELSRSCLVSVLATPATVARDYTHDLVRTYAAHCAVTLVGSRELASLAEAFMQGEEIADTAILAEIAPAFVTAGESRTDCVVLACTHYPLLCAQLERLAPWPVAWIDPAPAIARQTDKVLRARNSLSTPEPQVPVQVPGQVPGQVPVQVPVMVAHQALFTGPAEPGPKLLAALRRRGLETVVMAPMPLVNPPA